MLENGHQYYTTLQTLIKEIDPHSFNEFRIFLIPKPNTTLAKQNKLGCYPFENGYPGPKLN